MLEKLLKALLANPSDRAAQNALADWLHERPEQIAAALGQLCRRLLPDFEWPLQTTGPWWTITTTNSNPPTFGGETTG